MYIMVRVENVGDKDMKITVICDVYGYNNNGTTLASRNLVNALTSKGHTVSVVSGDAKPSGKERVCVLPPLRLGPLVNTLLKKNEVVWCKPDKNILEQTIKDADVVHLALPFICEWKAVKIAKKYNKIITASFHCQAENCTAHFGVFQGKLMNKLLYKLFYHKVYKHCQVIHYPTEFIRDTFESSIKKRLPSVVVSNGVNADFFEKRERVQTDKFTILCSGRYSKEKSQGDLIKAVAHSKHKDNIRIILAGCGPRYAQYKKLAEKFGVDCQFGFFSRQQLIEKMYSSNLYVHTSVAEIEAIACMEAIVTGLVPIICNSKQSATRFFAVDDNNLFGKHKYLELRNRIDYFYETPTAIKEYEKLYESKKNTFKLEDCMDKMERMFQEVAK